MSDGRSTDLPGTDGSEPKPTIRLLHVEDDDAFADLTGEYLSRVAPEITHHSVTTVTDARRRYEQSPFDAVVCDHDLPDGTGIDFLEHVRSDDEEFPFILFTGKGSEEIASEAISAGVTDYLQKRGGSDQYEMLANRVRNAVDRHHLKRQVERGVTALETATEPIGILDEDGTYIFVNQAYADVYGLDPEDLRGVHFERIYPAEEVDRFTDEVLPRLTREGHWTGEATGRHVDGTPIDERLALTHTTSGGHVCVIRDAEHKIGNDE